MGVEGNGEGKEGKRRKRCGAGEVLWRRQMEYLQSFYFGSGGKTGAAISREDGKRRGGFAGGAGGGWEAVTGGKSQR
jgi:hypothetical protein